jgi:hypothetical protein
LKKRNTIIPKECSYQCEKDCYDLLFCSECWEEIDIQSVKKGIKFETKKYVYEQVIKEIESSDLEQ